MNRRAMLGWLAAGAAVGSLPSLPAAAEGPDRPRLVLLNLRGGLDGLAALAPYGDPRYGTLRGSLALAPPGTDDGLLKLDGLFGVHPKLRAVYAMYRQGDAVFFHAVATPYRARSHFDAQKVLENGTSDPGAVTGWVNRLAGAQPGLSVLSIGANVPLIVRGEAPVRSWAPSALPEIDDDTLRRIRDLYSHDPFFAERLEIALDGPAGAPQRGFKRRPRGQLQAMVDPLVDFLRDPEGPQVIALDWGGWDTHANQGAAEGPLANRLDQLDTALAALSEGAGHVWKQTVLIVFTEFGRTARINGTQGTDHGTAAVAFAVGGALAGGRLIADWPGLDPRALLDGRDLRPTHDLREVFAGALVGHLGVDEGVVHGVVFPGAGFDPVALV